MRNFFGLFNLRRRSRDKNIEFKDSDLSSLRKILSYNFTDLSFLKEALTHRSYSASNNLPSNQRLEFLGDAVIEIVTAHALFDNYPEKGEGPLTEARASLVNGSSLANVSRKLGLGKYILLSPEEDIRDGRENPSILADLYEAIAGAIYIDGGYAEAKKFIENSLLVDLSTSFQQALLTNYKSRLLEYAQANSLGNIKDAIVNQTGPDHAKIFEVEVVLNGDSLGRGSGKRLKDAEQKAAQESLALLNVTNEKPVQSTD